MYGCVRISRLVPRWGMSTAIVAVVVGVLAIGQADAAKRRPDLIVASVGNPPAAATAGGTLTIKDRVENRRARAKRSSTGLFLSSDEFRDLSDYSLGSRSVKGLKAKKASRGSSELTIPATVPTGAYRLLACADAAG